MRWSAANSKDADIETLNAEYPTIRFFAVRERRAPLSGDDIEGAWVSCSPETVKAFSAVAYFFGRDLQVALKKHPPVGLIHISSGASIQAWVKGVGDITADVGDAATLSTSTVADYLRTVDFAEPPLTDESRLLALPATPDEDWPSMNLPTPNGWEALPGMKDLNGVVWFRRAIAIPPEWNGKELTLRLGVIKDTDTTFFNGVNIASTGLDIPNHGKLQRVYTVPKLRVKAGTATLAIRVFNNRGLGGVLTGPLQIGLADNSSPPLSLMGAWKYHIEHAVTELPPPSLQNADADVPGSVFSGTVLRIIPYSIAGILWYQGESDTGNPEEYRRLFPMLIQSWREAWGQPRLPFFWAQLANFMERKPEPVDTAWARLRDAQAHALRLPGTAQVVLIDAGESDNVHPRNKQIVGERFARIALALVYGQNVVHGGPVFKKVRASRDGALVVTFDPRGRGLDTRGERLEGFAVAGSDGVYACADAVIEGSTTVVVRSPQVPHPVSVRYAWGDNPAATLCNRDGLPVGPFEAKIGIR